MSRDKLCRGRMENLLPTRKEQVQGKLVISREFLVIQIAMRMWTILLLALWHSVAFTHFSKSGDSPVSPSSCRNNTGCYVISHPQKGLVQSRTSFGSNAQQLGKAGFTYDAFLRIASSTDARNGATVYWYNAADQVTTVVSAPPTHSQGPQQTAIFMTAAGG